jgi:hypothetical protein
MTCPKAALARLAALAASALALGLVTAPVAPAATTLGSSLVFNGNGALTGGCNPLCTIIPVDVNDANPVTSPTDGVIVRYGVQPADGAGVYSTVRVRVLQAAGGGSFVGEGTGPTQQTTVSHGNTFFDLKPGVPIKAGRYIGVDTARNGTTSASTWRGVGGASYRKATTPVPDGSAGTTTEQLNSEAYVQATVEPDADGDRFGDESQDKCIGVAGGVDGCTPSPAIVQQLVDRVAPGLGLAIAPVAFPAADQGGSVARRRRRAGTRVTYTLSEAALVTFRVQRRARGRRVGRRCAKPRKKNRRRRRCIRYVRLRGSFSHRGATGRGSFRFTGRLRGRKLAPRRYRLVGTATDSFGNRGKGVGRRFRVLR